GIELQARAGITVEEAPELVQRVDALGDDEPDRAGLASERLGERAARLPEREVERRALERPAPVEPERVHARRLREELEAVEQPREAVERGRACEREVARRRMQLGRVGHVLADALLARTLE